MRSFIILSLFLSGTAMAADLTADCAGCHGKDGISQDPNVPAIAGMSVTYLSGTIKDYKDKKRTGAEMAVPSGDKKGQKSDMNKAVAGLSDADIASLAANFSGKPFVRAKQQADAGLAAKGKAIHEQLCEKCHTEIGSVADDDSGFLAGQWMPYLKTQLLDYKTGKRPVPAKMQPKLDQVPLSDIDALVNFYGSQK